MQSGQGGDNNLANLDEEDEADFEAQLMLLNRGKPQQNTSNQRQEGPNVSKRLAEFESRQKIFEDEIIKRIKEIQRYTKSIHLQVKKQQTAQQEVEEHQDRFET